MDIPEGEFRNYLGVSKTLLDFVKANYFKFINNYKIAKLRVCSIFSEIFSALTDFTMEDELSIKEAFIPFLIEINDIIKIDDIMKKLYLTIKIQKKSDIFFRLMNCKFFLIFKNMFFTLN